MMRRALGHMQRKARCAPLESSASEADAASGKPAPESHCAQDDHEALRLWMRMLSCTVRIEDSIRARLRAGFHITLPRFDLMAQLAREPDGVRMGELSRRMMVSGGNVTAITDQLEREKLVQRLPDPQDRRVFVVRLTPAGRRSFQRMAQAHESWVAELFDGLAPQDKASLSDILGRIRQQLTNKETGDASPARTKA